MSDLSTSSTAVHVEPFSPHVDRSSTASAAPPTAGPKSPPWSCDRPLPVPSFPYPSAWHGARRSCFFPSPLPSPLPSLPPPPPPPSPSASPPAPPNPLPPPPLPARPPLRAADVCPPRAPRRRPRPGAFPRRRRDSAGAGPAGSTRAPRAGRGGSGYVGAAHPARCAGEPTENTLAAVVETTPINRRHAHHSTHIHKPYFAKPHPTVERLLTRGACAPARRWGDLVRLSSGECGGSRARPKFALAFFQGGGEGLGFGGGPPRRRRRRVTPTPQRAWRARRAPRRAAALGKLVPARLSAPPPPPAGGARAGGGGRGRLAARAARALRRAPRALAANRARVGGAPLPYAPEGPPRPRRRRGGARAGGGTRGGAGPASSALARRARARGARVRAPRWVGGWGLGGVGERRGRNRRPLRWRTRVRARARGAPCLRSAR